jgi:hypothetical protein
MHCAQGVSLSGIYTQASDFEKEKRRYSHLKSKKMLDPQSLAFDDLLFLERGKALYE